MRLALAASSGEASSLMAMTAMSMPCWRAASSTRNGKRPLPAIRPQPVTKSFASAVEIALGMDGAVSGTLLDDAALGAFDELDQFLHVRGATQSFFHLFQRLRGVELGAQQQAVSDFQRREALGGKTFALQADGIDAVAGGL